MLHHLIKTAYITLILITAVCIGYVLPRPTAPVDPVTLTTTDHASTFGSLQLDYVPNIATDFVRLTMSSDVQTLIGPQSLVEVCDRRQFEMGADSAEIDFVTLNDEPFCRIKGMGVGAGQLHINYTYVTVRGERAYTVAYAINTVNSCGAYQDSNDVNAPENTRYRDCLAYKANFNELVVKEIEKSAGSFK